MKRICAWCKKKLPDVEPLEDETISHGMCEECGKRIKEETKELKEGTGFIQPS